MERYEAALKSIEEQGAKQAVPVKVAPMAPGEREKWASTMPNLASDWVKANASRGPAAEIMKTYMEELRKRGAQPVRDWDKRSEERRVGKACVSTCRSRWAPYH